MTIQSFSCSETEDFFNTGSTIKFAAVQHTAARKLTLLHAAQELKDMKSPPGNKLHPLTGDRAGQHAIRINDKYRVCFVWTPAGPEKVEITDYH